MKIADPTTTFCKIVEDPRSMLMKGVDEIYKKNVENFTRHSVVTKIYSFFVPLPGGKRYPLKN